MLSLLLIGLCAGTLTTVVGFGGGLLAISVLSLSHGPAVALAISAPALLIANLHRFTMYRAYLPWRADPVADPAAGERVSAAGLAPMFAGLVLGAAGLAWLTPRLPARAMAVLMLLVAAFAVAQAMRRAVWRPRRGPLFAVAVGLGGLAAASGPAGVLIGPLLLGMGLTGRGYLATMSLGAVLLHTARVVGYVGGGLLTSVHLPAVGVLTLALMFGNHLGDRLRAHVGPTWARRVELAAPLAAAAIIAITAW